MIQVFVRRFNVKLCGFKCMRSFSYDIFTEKERAEEYIYIRRLEQENRAILNENKKSSSHSPNEKSSSPRNERATPISSPRKQDN